VYHFPEWKVNEATKCDNITKLSHLIIGPEHGQIETAEERNAINSKMGGGHEEADQRRDNNGNEPNRLLPEGHDRIRDRHGMRQEAD